MRRTLHALTLMFLATCLLPPSAWADDPPPLDRYFRAETARIAGQPLAGIDSAQEWKARRPELQRQLADMLGLSPMPEKSALSPRITGTVDQPSFVVEKLLFQSMPGLYVTANLYRPRALDRPAPAVLYVCGHAKVERDGLIYGCKAHYQHHPAWYAANGYVCLVVDTLQLGELPGLHHGTNRFGMWWWAGLGYTPAGIETWNGIRAIDYLLSRPDVDPSRVAVTGRSGGGATSWFLGALDDRLAAVVAVAGITDLENHVVDGVVEGHCDCMYVTNTYRWDYATLAALVAPKPLLVENTDHDPIFPESGVRRIYSRLETVYGWYDAADRLGLVMGKGGHVDSTEIRHPSFAFMDRWLMGTERPIVESTARLPIHDLKVLEPGEVPEGSRNASIHDSFLRPATVADRPATPASWEAMRKTWLEALRARVFAGWPSDTDPDVPLERRVLQETSAGPLTFRVEEFTSQAGVPLNVWVRAPTDAKPDSLRLLIVDEADSLRFRDLVESAKDGPGLGRLFDQQAESLGLGVIPETTVVAILAPRGVGPDAWPASSDRHLRRRFLLLGQTLDGMRIWDIRRALANLREHPALGSLPTHLAGRGKAAHLALWATVFSPEVRTVRLVQPPATLRDGPTLLNVERILGFDQALALVAPRRVEIVPIGDGAELRWATDLGTRLGWDTDWLKTEPRSH